MLELTRHQCQQLLDVFGGDEDPEVTVTVSHCKFAHGGPGVYAWFSELPEEGSVRLDEQPANAPSLPASAPGTLPPADGESGAQIGNCGCIYTDSKVCDGSCGRLTADGVEGAS